MGGRDDRLEAAELDLLEPSLFEQELLERFLRKPLDSRIQDQLERLDGVALGGSQRPQDGRDDGPAPDRAPDPDPHEGRAGLQGPRQAPHLPAPRAVHAPAVVPAQRQVHDLLPPQRDAQVIER